jgi:hypothetical protein
MTLAAWTSPLDAIDDATSVHGPVRAALLTTFDVPDAELLVEDLLPRWLGLHRVPSADESAQHQFLAELAAELDRLHGSIHVISSPPRHEDVRPHWLWSYVRRHHVGAKTGTRAVQHAKLWILHRVGHAGIECLDLWISSTNLTRSAFTGQIQSGWRCCVPLQGVVRDANRQSWGPLSDFLQELGTQSGDAAKTAIETFLLLLSRARCPQGVQFVASVPGRHRSKRWGVDALGIAIAGRGTAAMDILVPTVGEWDSKGWNEWSRAAGTRPDRISIAWPAQYHRWSKSWCVPELSWAAFSELSTNLLEWPQGEDDSSPLHEKHIESKDHRWLHGKCYWLRRGRRSWVLVTSANLSPSAWGASVNGSLVIRNFEFGVLLFTDQSPLTGLNSLASLPSFSIENEDKELPGENSTPWLAATFQNGYLCLHASGYERPSASIEVRLADGTNPTKRAHWTQQTDGWEATVPCTGSLPQLIRIIGTVAWIPVWDQRSATERRATPLVNLPGLDPRQLAAIRLSFMESRYARCQPDLAVLEPAKRPATENQQGSDRPTAARFGYGLPVMDLSRRLSAVVDGWRSERVNASNGLRRYINADGESLRDSWDALAKEGVSASAYQIACDELDILLGSES